MCSLVSFVGSLYNYIVEPSGFERGWQAEEILGATEVDKEILFLIRWYVILHSTDCSDHTYTTSNGGPSTLWRVLSHRHPLAHPPS